MKTDTYKTATPANTANQIITNTYGWRKPWDGQHEFTKDLSMDFMVGSSESEGNDIIWMVVDRQSKMKQLVPS
jgi:hypothetical protein